MLPVVFKDLRACRMASSVASLPDGKGRKEFSILLKYNKVLVITKHVNIYQ